MINQDYLNQVQDASARFAERKLQRQRAEKLISQKKFLNIDSPDRVDQFLKRRGFSQFDIHNLVKNTITNRQEMMPVPGQPPKRLEMIIGDNDLTSVCFLQKGLNTAPATGRIRVINNNSQLVGYATGFMVSPQLLLTNHHVLGDETTLANSLLEFNYQTNLDGTMDKSVLFGFDSPTFYYKDKDLDFVMIAVKTQSTDGQPLSKYGWNKLIEDAGKAIIGQYINIIQHPNADPKEIAIRNNQLIDIFDDFLHYKTDTLPGSSGSGLYNDQWEIIGLHHASLPVNNNGQGQTDNPGISPASSGDNDTQFENEGIRISSIIKELKAQNMTVQQRALFAQCFTDMPTAVSSQTPESIPTGKNTPYAQTVNDDGSATWTIPVSITINVGNGASNASKSSPAIANTNLLPVITTPDTTTGAPASANQILQNARNSLTTISHVIGVEMGYKFTDGKITNDRAIVVTMDSNGAAVNRIGLPNAYQGYPLEILGPGLEDILIQTKNSHVNELLLSRNNAIEEIVYTPPPGADLSVVEEGMKAIFHVSPEEGWKNLKPFLEDTTKELVVGMYDFGAKHILDAIVGLKAKPGFKMSMAIQKGQSLSTGGSDDDSVSATKKNDMKDADVVDKLKATFGDNFDFAWVKIGVVNGWVASSYHIKVAVRDSKSVWLSSGNWQSSNQPDLDILHISNDEMIKEYNREWHVIVEDQKLAQAYREFILNDVAENKKLQHMEIAELLELAPAFYINEFKPAAKAPYKPFPVKSFNGNLKIMPLLTPDNYFDEAIKLIKSATETLFIENQTFNAAKDTNAKLTEFLNAVLDRLNDGVDVKIIFRLFMKTDAMKNLMGLKTAGFNTNEDHIRLLPNCHTKGIIVDGKTVLLGSQNISEQGISINRDASLIVYNKEIAGYFTDIFNNDWGRATNMLPQENNELKVMQPGQQIPQEHRFVSLKEMLEML